jgi:hypothetical protein
MAKLPETLVIRVLIQANWQVAAVSYWRSWRWEECNGQRQRLFATTEGQEISRWCLRVVPWPEILHDEPLARKFQLTLFLASTSLRTMKTLKRVGHGNRSVNQH